MVHSVKLLKKRKLQLLIILYIYIKRTFVKLRQVPNCFFLSPMKRKPHRAEDPRQGERHHCTICNLKSYSRVDKLRKHITKCNIASAVLPSLLPTPLPLPVHSQATHAKASEATIANDSEPVVSAAPQLQSCQRFFSVPQFNFLIPPEDPEVLAKEEEEFQLWKAAKLKSIRDARQLLEAAASQVNKETHN